MIHIKNSLPRTLAVHVRLFFHTGCLFILLLTGWPEELYAGTLYQVSRVIDGDTVLLDNGQRIRLLGINAPEISHRNKPAELGGIRAKDYLNKVLLKRLIHLEYDVERRDHYGRQLAHIYLDNGEHVNVAMLRLGLATLSIHPPNLQHARVLAAAEYVAQELGLGLWSQVSHQLRPINQLSAGLANKWGRYEAVVVKTKRFKQGTQLHLSDNSYVWISASDYEYFQALKTYVGRRVELRGWPKQRGGYWSIKLIHSSQLIMKPDRY